MMLHITNSSIWIPGSVFISRSVCVRTYTESLVELGGIDVGGRSPGPSAATTAAMVGKMFKWITTKEHISWGMKSLT